MTDQFQISLAAARVNAEMTQDEVANALNVSRNTIIKWESGKVIPRTPQLMALSQVYHIPIEAISLPEKTT